MNFTVEQKPYGEHLTTTFGHVVFGNRYLTESLLSQQHELLTPSKHKHLTVTQVHGNTLVPACESRPQADAHWTERAEYALNISTADCLPILLLSPRISLAIHAGWKGILSNIIGKSIQYLVNFHQLNVHQCLVAIGPHIRQDSFEFSKSESLQFIECARQFGGDTLVLKECFNRSDKVLIDLTYLARLQIQRFVPSQQVYLSPVNTFTNNSYHSYRRSHKSAGRNVSFVVLNGSDSKNNAI